MKITSAVNIPESELTFAFVQASGPGGQNVNKVASAVELRFDLLASRSLPAQVKQRLIALAGRRMTGDGVLVIQARRSRSQDRNRADAEQRLADLVRRALVPPRPRRPTRPTQASRTRRLESKKRRAAVKNLRRPRLPESE